MTAADDVRARAREQIAEALSCIPLEDASHDECVYWAAQADAVLSTPIVKEALDRMPEMTGVERCPAGHRRDECADWLCAYAVRDKE